MSAVRVRHRPPAFAPAALRPASPLDCARRPPVAARRAKTGLILINYVCLSKSVAQPDETYVRLTDNLKSRLAAHNAGRSPHTSKFKPWRLVTYIAFSDERKAVDFEQYLKSASGRAFAKKRLR